MSDRKRVSVQEIARNLSYLLAFGCALASPICAGLNPPEATAHVALQQESKADEWDGEVQNYQPGSLLVVRKRPQVEVTFDLTKKDAVYSIAPGVEKLSKVHLSEQDENGMHHVTVTLKEKMP